MARWQVELTGHAFDLEELPGLFTAPDLRVVEQDGRYFLEAEQFEALTESGAVHASALALLPRINGAAKLKHRKFRDVALRGHIREVDEDGMRQHAIATPATVEVRANVPTPAILVDGEQVLPAPGSLDSDQWMRGAALSAYAGRALELWGGAHDPTAMWKVWELLRDHSGLTIDPGLRRRFCPALNDRTIAGDDARHEVPMTSYPVEPDTMSLPEAEAFLGGLLEQWLRSLP